MTSTVPGRAGQRPRRGPRSTERAVRKRRTHRRYLVRRWTVLGSVLAVLALAYSIFFTSLLGVRGVDVLGVKELSADDVRAAAAIEPGTPLVRLDTDEIAQRVRTLPRVGSVEVRRSYPGTVEIAISERTPVAVVVSPDGAHLLDAAGVDYGVIPAAPPGLPRLTAKDAAASTAAVSVLAGIPAQLTGQVTAVAANGTSDIRLTLADGRVVKWGDARDTERKSAVLGPLLTRPGKTYDVAAPDFPTVS
ncbi:FtsQ-type POTRA domain-containing protein [Actinokineospora sp. NBRC 105648]|uniref:cell division protein FtsQ/DivIB n=1 Tax=Actinokineospora sp. NBRC 105648 TaxID=3032206 RepID=UPI0024A5A4A3|nr:FtsQ-type POTRA domain-containing protein [Actinokineospora sp. NBRC 105648]GLZ42165.1 cell division protein FtsQ [Actinokineospora sp. NBRC 105648]